MTPVAERDGLTALERLRLHVHDHETFPFFHEDAEEILEEYEVALTELQHRRAAEAGSYHRDDLAVDRFAAAMKAKLALKRAEGRGGWDRKDECTAEFLSELLRGHVEKGEPVDVGNFAMMLHQRGERITQGAAVLAASPSPPATGVRVKALEWTDGVTSSAAPGYRIEYIDGRFYARSHEASGMFGTIEFAETLDAAKAAAQADYEARIRSALGEQS